MKRHFGKIPLLPACALAVFAAIKIDHCPAENFAQSKTYFACAPDATVIKGVFSAMEFLSQTHQVLARTVITSFFGNEHRVSILDEVYVDIRYASRTPVQQ